MNGAFEKHGNEEGFLKPNGKDETLTALPPSPHWGMTFTRLSSPLYELIGSRS